MVSANVARNVVGIIGNVISFGLFLSPVPTFYRIIKKKDVEEFQPFPYLAAVLNCYFWTLYGLPIVVKNNILVTTINAVGLAIELIYLSIFYLYSGKKMRIRVSFILLGEAVFMAVVVVITVLALKFKHRAVFVGIMCDIFNIIMYASPLAIWKKVITTKSVEFMPFYLSLASFSNGCVWTAYSLIKLDVYMLVCNGLGALFGAIQLILYAIYYPSTPKKKKSKETVKPAEVQLSAQVAAV
ncbi:hypothetical protein SLE2022_280190 [Rubroshorea leprosula]